MDRTWDVFSTFDVVVAVRGRQGLRRPFALARVRPRVLLAGADDAPADQSRRIAASGRSAAFARDRRPGPDSAMTDTFPCMGNLSVWGSPAVRCVDFIFDPNGRAGILDRPFSTRRSSMPPRAAGSRGPWRSCATRSKRHQVAGVSGSTTGAPLDTKSAAIGSSTRAAAGPPRAATGRDTAPQRPAGRLYGRCRTERSTDTELHTMVEAVPDGWWYTSLVPGGRRVFIYLTDVDLAPRGITRGTGASGRLIDQTACIGPYVLAFRYISTCRRWPAQRRTARLDPPAGDGWAAAGRCGPGP